MNKKLKGLINKASNTLYYRKLWENIDVNNFQFERLTLSDRELFNSKKIKESLAVKENQISYYYFSAGTTNNPKMIPFTNREWLKRSVYRKKCYELIGINKSSKVAILLPFGPWIAGPSVQSALMNLGCVVFPMGLLSEEGEVNGLFSIIQRHRIDTLITVPSFLQNLLTFYSISKNKINLKRIITSGEYIHDTLRDNLTKSFGAAVYSSYATSESFIGVECAKRNGFHYDPKEIIVEVLDQSTYLPTNNTGLIVITSLSSEAVPLLRYCLSDLGVIEHSKCSCGSFLPRIIWKGRANETFTVAGAVNVYSYQIYNALSKSDIPISRCEIEIYDNGTGKDSLKFNLYTKAERNTWSNSIKKKLKDILSNISMDFKDVVYYKIVKIKINLEQDNTINHAIKKRTVKIIDKRQYAR